MYKRENRGNNELRKIALKKDVMINAYASIEVCYGDTRIFCTASISDQVPPFAEAEEKGWLSAEYNMLPASTGVRKKREIGKQDGRSVEISRLIGRALRASIDLEKIKGYSIIIDCDVIQADGGTRTASITGGYCALKLAVMRMVADGLLAEDPMIAAIASVSIGKVNGEIMIDLDYIEDSSAEVDYNLVFNDRFEYIELQGTAEHGVMTKADFMQILELCEQNAKQIFNEQNRAIHG